MEHFNLENDAFITSNIINVTGIDLKKTLMLMEENRSYNSCK